MVSYTTARRLWAIALLSALTGCDTSGVTHRTAAPAQGLAAQGPTPPTPSAARPARLVAHVPLTLDAARRMYVRADLGGGVGATLLIDTGNGFNYLSTAVQGRLRLPTAPLVYGPDRRPLIADGGWMRGVTPRMTLGGALKVQKVAFVLRSPARLPISPLTGRPVEGIVGADLLQRFDVLLDAPARRLTVWYPPGQTEGEIRAQGLRIAHTVPISPSRLGSGVWAARARLTGHGASTDEEMVVDTGATVTVVSRAASERLGLAPRAGGQAIIWQNRPVPVGTDRVDRIHLGDMTVADQPVRFPTTASSYCPVSLGMDVLGTHPPLMDFGARRMYLIATGRGHR